MRRGLFLVAALLSACTTDRELDLKGTIRVTVTAVDGNAPPDEDAPLPPNLGATSVPWAFTAEFLDAEGNLDTTFNGFTRVSVVPGAVDSIEGPGAIGRNVQFSEGRAEAVAHVTAVFGPSRLWLEDLGYVPAPPGVTPLCANGIDDDGDVTADFPNDPGCAFADDMTEEGGTLVTGVSPVVHYELPTLADVQGRSSTTPFPAVAVNIKTNSPSSVIVTRVASAGFFVTDIGDPIGEYNHMFAFNFNTPVGMRVCNRLNILSGTVAEFFGFTELAFPSYEVGRVDPLASTPCRRDDDCRGGEFCEKLGAYTLDGVCQRCLVPPPTVLDNTNILDDPFLESLESGLVTVEQLRISPNLGPNTPEEVSELVFAFSPTASNCDLNGDGETDFQDQREGTCSNQCAADPECSDWIGFASRGNYKGHRGNGTGQCGLSAACILVNTGTAQGFDVLEHRGKTLAYVTGVLRNFSGGSLNWTIETRCGDDLGCNFSDACVDIQGCLADCDAADQACIDECNLLRDPSRACITPATEDDNDAGTN